MAIAASEVRRIRVVHLFSRGHPANTCGHDGGSVLRQASSCYHAVMPNLRSTWLVDADRRYLVRAIALARRGEGRVEPNPMVGCVIVRKDRVIGEGFHRRFGGPHAEINALRSCNDSPRGATVYVSLEPCCHAGKTPPCTDALIGAGVARVVAAVADPNPAVAGGGLRALRAAGIDATIGFLETEAAEVLAPYLTLTRLGRSYVIAKWAQSLDGKLATRTGDSKWISNRQCRREVHRLRARMDAILVGSGTVLTDDPRLTARDVPLRRTATRVVFDGRLRLAKQCQLVVTSKRTPTLVLTVPANARSRKADRLRRAGVEVVACRTAKDRISIRAALGVLGRRRMTNVLVEGGPALLSAFLAARMVDEAWVYTAPILIGGRAAPTAFAEVGVATIAASLRPRTVETRRIGSDMRHHLRLTDVPIDTAGV